MFLYHWCNEIAKFRKNDNCPKVPKFPVESTYDVNSISVPWYPNIWIHVVFPWISHRFIFSSLQSVRNASCTSYMSCPATDGIGNCHPIGEICQLTSLLGKKLAGLLPLCLTSWSWLNDWRKICMTWMTAMRTARVNSCICALVSLLNFRSIGSSARFSRVRSCMVLMDFIVVFEWIPYNPDVPLDEIRYQITER